MWLLTILIIRAPRMPGANINEVPNSAVGQQRNSHIPPEAPNLSWVGGPGRAKGSWARPRFSEKPQQPIESPAQGEKETNSSEMYLMLSQNKALFVFCIFFFSPHCVSRIWRISASHFYLATHQGLSPFILPYYTQDGGVHP